MDMAPIRRKGSKVTAGSAFVRFAAVFGFSVTVLFALCLSFPSFVFANPDDAIPPTDDGSVGIYSGGASQHDPDDNTLGIDPAEQVRDEQGRVSQLSTTTHNPYNKQIRLSIDIGSEFADFEGCDVTEGYIVKVSPGGTVSLPKIKARDGYYFVGWGQGGVPYEPTWGPFVEEVEMGTDTSNGKNTTIYALFADDEGNGYCTCGSYEGGIYEDKIDEIKAANSEYDKVMGYSEPTDIPIKVIAVVFFILLAVACLVLAAVKDHKDGLAGDTEYL